MSDLIYVRPPLQAAQEGARPALLQRGRLGGLWVLVRTPLHCALTRLWLFVSSGIPACDMILFLPYTYLPSGRSRLGHDVPRKPTPHMLWVGAPPGASQHPSWH